MFQYHPLQIGCTVYSVSVQFYCSSVSRNNYF